MADKGIALLGKSILLSGLLFTSVTECRYVTYYCQTTTTSCNVKCSPGSAQLFGLSRVGDLSLEERLQGG